MAALYFAFVEHWQFFFFYCRARY